MERDPRELLARLDLLEAVACDVIEAMDPLMNYSASTSEAVLGAQLLQLRTQVRTARTRTRQLYRDALPDRGRP